jgi:hypothetical protein
MNVGRLVGARLGVFCSRAGLSPFIGSPRSPSGWGGGDLYGDVAGEGSHTIGEKLNSSFISSERMALWPRKE